MTPEPRPSSLPTGEDADSHSVTFSRTGAAELEMKAQRYLSVLEQVSQSVAINDGLDVVSAPHVRRAAELLGLSARKKFNWPREVGALLIGVGLTTLSAVLIASSYTFLSGLLICIPILGGFGLYLYGVARD
jgi:hypothetical protein